MREKFLKYRPISMRLQAAFLLVAVLLFVSCAEPKANAEDGRNAKGASAMQNPPISQNSEGVDVGQIEDIPPEIRLRDYKKQTRYPPFSRPAVPESENDIFHLAGYIGTPTKDARIIGVGASAIRGGQVYLPIRLEVHKAGKYRIETLLHGGDGKACLVASREVPLPPGTQTVELRFFGLAFHEDAVCKRGPWFIEGIVGRKVPDLESLEPGEEPVEAPLLPYKKRHTISIPNIALLSKKEWDSPTKRQRIAELEEEIRKQALREKQGRP